MENIAFKIALTVILTIALNHNSTHYTLGENYQSASEMILSRHIRMLLMVIILRKPRQEKCHFI